MIQINDNIIFVMRFVGNKINEVNLIEYIYIKYLSAVKLSYILKKTL